MAISIERQPTTIPGTTALITTMEATVSEPPGPALRPVFQAQSIDIYKVSLITPTASHIAYLVVPDGVAIEDVMTDPTVIVAP